MNCRVVLIDDDQDDIYLFQYALNSQYPTIELSGYGSAAAFLEAHSFVARPQLILLDNGLPGQTGVEWLQTFSEHPCCQEVPVVILTGSDSEQHQQAAYQAGAAGFLVKPQTQEQLQELLDYIVETWLSD